MFEKWIDKIRCEQKYFLSLVITIKENTETHQVLTRCEQTFSLSNVKLASFFRLVYNINTLQTMTYCIYIYIKRDGIRFPPKILEQRKLEPNSIHVHVWDDYTVMLESYAVS